MARAGFRARLAGHAFTHEHRQRLGCGQLILAGHAVIALGAAGLLQPCGQVGGDSLHVPRAKDLHAGLFERVIDHARITLGRQGAGVHIIVMVAHAERDAVGGPSQLLHLGLGQRAGGYGQAGAAAGQARGAGLEGDLDICRVGDGAHGAGGGALEVLGAIGVFGHGGDGVLRDGKEGQEQGRTPFLKKRSKKLFSLCATQNDPRFARSYNQKSFCFFFFRKRRVFLRCPQSISRATTRSISVRTRRSTIEGRCASSQPLSIGRTSSRTISSSEMALA